MKVLHVVHGYHPARGGSEHLMQQVSEHLVAHYGDDVTVFTANGTNNEAFVNPQRPLLPTGTTTHNGVTVRRFPVFNRLGKPLYHVQRLAYQLRLPGNQYLRTLYNGPILPGLHRAITHCNADVIAAAAFPLLHMHIALRAGRRSGKPVVLIGALHPLNEWGYQRRMIYRAIARADAYIALSAYERDYLINQWQIDGDKITVIGAGVELEPFVTADPQQIRRTHGVGSAPIVGFIGQQGPNKGVDTLILAMKRVWQNVPQAWLLIAGARTHYTPTLQRLIQSELPPDKQQQIILRHDFSEVEKPALFAACDIFAYPSRYESFGIAYVEAWAAGKPVIGCHAGAVPTVIDDGRNGLLVPTDDEAALAAALQTLLAAPERRQQMGEAGRQKVQQQYTWTAVSAKWRNVYIRVAK